MPNRSHQCSNPTPGTNAPHSCGTTLSLLHCHWRKSMHAFRFDESHLALNPLSPARNCRLCCSKTFCGVAGGTSSENCSIRRSVTSILGSSAISAVMACTKIPDRRQGAHRCCWWTRQTLVASSPGKAALRYSAERSAVCNTRREVTSVQPAGTGVGNSSCKDLAGRGGAANNAFEIAA